MGLEADQIFFNNKKGVIQKIPNRYEECGLNHAVNMQEEVSR